MGHPRPVRKLLRGAHWDGDGLAVRADVGGCPVRPGLHVQALPVGCACSVWCSDIDRDLCVLGQDITTGDSDARWWIGVGEKRAVDFVDGLKVVDQVSKPR